MEANIWVELAKLAVAFLGGGGLWSWITKREDKRKTPYDMFRELLAEQKSFTKNGMPIMNVKSWIRPKNYVI